MSYAYDVLLSPPVVDYDASGLLPGDVIGLDSGVYSSISIRNCIGTPAEPIIICNCNGQVQQVGAGDQQIYLSNSSHTRWTGSGTENIQYGFYFTNNMLIYNHSTSVEIDHVEFDHARLRMYEVTDPNWEMTDCKIHDNYIHEYDSTGIYVGGYTAVMRRIQIYNNIVSDTSRGINVRRIIEDCEVFGNYVEDIVRPGETSNPGIEISDNTVARVFRNTFKNCAYGGIYGNSDGSMKEIYSNLLVDCGQDASWPDAIKTGHYDKYKIFNNTIISAARNGIHFASAATTDNEAFNNIILDTMHDPIHFDASPPSNFHHNHTKDDGYTPQNYGFVDEAGGDYHLMPYSPGVDVGADAGLPYQGAAPDIGAYEYVTRLLRAILQGSHRGVLRGVMRGVM